LIIDDDGSMWFRQSWLDTAMRCPEEGRLATVKPEWDITSDAAIVGTGAHAGIEKVIKGADPAHIGDLAHENVMTTEEPFRFVQHDNRESMARQAAACAIAWRRDILPHLNLEDAQAEVEFKVPLFEHRGRTIGIKGTCDLAPNAPELLDWKTSKRPYKQSEKQRWAIQPTIYALAAIKGGIRSDIEYSWPLEFTYGVMVKTAKPTGQLVTVQRTEQHAEWAMHRLRTLADLAIDFGFDKPWPQIDDSNYLCSATWCAFHPICRGAFLRDGHDRWEPLAMPTTRSAA
jgi:hypothetical protein